MGSATNKDEIGCKGACCTRLVSKQPFVRVVPFYVLFLILVL
jgi:hypothetical protein